MANDEGSRQNLYEKIVSETLDRLDRAIEQSTELLSEADHQALAVYLNHLHLNYQNDLQQAATAAKRIGSLIGALTKDGVRGLSGVRKAARAIEGVLLSKIAPQRAELDQIDNVISARSYAVLAPEVAFDSEPLDSPLRRSAGATPSEQASIIQRIVRETADRYQVDHEAAARIAEIVTSYILSERPGVFDLSPFGSEGEATGYRRLPSTNRLNRRRSKMSEEDRSEFIKKYHSLGGAIRSNSNDSAKEVVQADPPGFTIEQSFARSISVRLANPLWRTEDSSIAIYADTEENGQEIQAALEGVLESYGEEVIRREEPITGSWFRRMISRGKDLATSPAGKEVAAEIRRAVELHGVRKIEAEVNSIQSAAISQLITSLEKTSKAVVLLDATLLLKDGDLLTAHTLTVGQLSHLQRNPELLRDPVMILQEMKAVEHRHADKELLAQPAAFMLTDGNSTDDASYDR
ncbi:hypothetical protein AB0K21_35380 [Streptosporangium sp. NPDC049248]|uniref:hypothetical protein n=1 Tax=Streptosporangium sp. NPDC049248 TaxID=3155651 RepID=UPI003438E492